MTSKERFDLTVNHREPDKMVVDFGSTSVTGIHVLAVENLRKHYGLEYKPVRVTDPCRCWVKLTRSFGRESLELMWLGQKAKKIRLVFIITNH
jgi:hypothetical protein